MSSPGDLIPYRRGSLITHELSVEYDGRDQEETEKDDLDKQASDDDLFSDIVQVQCPSCLDAASARLECEGDDIASDKSPRNPSHGYQGEMLRAQGADEAAEDHINGSGEESRGDEDEDGLHDEAAESELVEV